MNKKKVLSIIAIVIGAIISITALVFLIKTMSFGETVSAEDNYTLYAERDFEEKILGHGSLFTSILLIGLSTLFAGLYGLLSKEFTKMYVYLSTMIVGAISAFEGASYGISYAAKVDKYISKIDITGSAEDQAYAAVKAYNKIMSYDNPWTYILWAVVGALILGYSISKLLKYYKNTSNK